MNKRLKVASLFAGIGGFDLAFSKAGFDIEWANELDIDACFTLKSNFNHSVIPGDIKHIHTPPDADVIVAGFPCQAFSIAGKMGGFADERGMIFFELLRIIKEIKPKAFLLENVKNLLSHNKGESFKIILNSLQEVGYHIKYQVINTCEHSNLPQNRERLYIVGFRNSISIQVFNFPEPIKKTLGVRDILESNVGDEYYYNHKKFYPILREKMKNKDTCYQWRRSYVRENKNGLCPTLTADMGTGGNNVPLVLDDKGIRKLTPRECFRFQGFPDDFILPETNKAKQYFLIGNSVSVPVVKRIAVEIYSSFNV